MNKIFKKLFLLLMVLSFGILISCELPFDFTVDEEVKEVNNLIENLGEITLDSKDDIDIIEEKFQSLTLEQQAKVSKYQNFLDKKAKYEDLYQRSIHPSLNVIDDISQIPYPLTFSSDEKKSIDSIVEAYNNLSAEEKALVTNYSTLTSVLDEYKEYQAIQEAIVVNNLIISIPSTLSYTEEERALINDIKAKYEALSADSKKHVVNYNNVLNVEKQLNNHEEELRINALKAQAKTVNDMIKSIPSTLTYSESERTLISNIKTEYNKLSAEVKKYVENYNLVTNAEKAISDYDKEQAILKIKEKVKSLNEGIKSFSDVTKVTLADETKLNNLKSQYEALTVQEKSYVDNYLYVTKALERIVVLKAVKNVVDSIDLLPTNVTLNDETKITNAKNAYDALNADSKALVTNYSKLQNCWTALNALKQGSTPYRVYFNLNGGELTGLLTENTTSWEELASVSINYFDKVFWSLSTNHTVLYSKSYIVNDTGSSYAYNLKIGFSYDATAKSYVVNQVIGDGTGFTETTRAASEYFIICNGSNGSDMSKLTAVGVGTYVSLDKSFPSAATDSLGATISFKTLTESGTTRQYIEYTGINTLSVPTLYGKKFVGWYDNPEFTGNPISEVSYSMTLYAKYEREAKIVTTETILNAVSDVVESDTEDELISSNSDATFTWATSNSDLYSVTNGVGKTSRYYQTHKKQTVKVSCTINYKSGGSKTVSKDVIINPVKFDDLPSTPVASYFAVGAASSYAKYSPRYQTEKKYFSDKAKEALDIIYYSFITPTKSGECTIYVPSYAPIVNELKNYNVRVIASINGVSTDTAAVFVECCSTDAKAADFAKRLMDTCEKYNFDGLDIDWEYVSSQPITAAAYTRLMKALRTEMDKRQDEGGTPYMLTAAIPSNSWTMDTSRYTFSDLNKYLDYINIMSYDANKTNVASHLAPHYSSSNDNGYGFGDVYGVNSFSRLGISKSKLLLGCAGYGKAYKVSGTSKNSNYPGLGATASLIQISEYSNMGSFASGTVYGNVVDLLEANSKYKKYTEYTNNGLLVGSYLYNATDKIFVTYDSSEAISAKYSYATNTEGMGVMCWAFTEDMSDHYINTCYECRKK